MKKEEDDGYYENYVFVGSCNQIDDGIEKDPHVRIKIKEPWGFQNLNIVRICTLNNTYLANFVTQDNH